MQEKIFQPTSKLRFRRTFSHLIFKEAGQILALQRFPDPRKRKESIFQRFESLFLYRCSILYSVGKGFQTSDLKACSRCLEGSPPGNLELSAAGGSALWRPDSKKLLQLLAAGIHDESGPGHPLQEIRHSGVFKATRAGCP